MLYSSGNQPQPVHLYRRIHGCVLSSAWSHEDYACTNLRVHYIWKEGLNPQIVPGMIVALVRMIWSSSASLKPGGKERRVQLLPTHKLQIHGALSESSELYGKP